MAEVLNDINNDTRTVIGLRHLDEIKAYVDGRIGEVSGEVTEEINEYLQNQLDAAKDKIEKDTEDKLKDLKDKLDQAILEGDENAIRDLQLKIDVLTEDLSTKFEALDAINGELDRINGKYGDLSNSIFTPGEIDELIKTAFIDGTYITNDSVTTPNVFTTKLVALIAKFGKIKAANIEAGAITGHTISCDNLDKNGNPMWSLNEDGSGNIAGENITWDKNGKVELGEDVTLSWKSVDNTGNPALDKLNKLENAQNDLKDIVNNGFQNIVSGWIEDGNLNPTEIKAIKSELEKITSNYELLNRYLDEIIDIYATAKNNNIDKEVKTKYYEDLKVAKKKLFDAYVNAKSVCEYYINANGNSIGTIKLNDAYDLDKINKYYEVQNEVTLFYQEANSFYTTDNRFGSKLTYIGEDGIYSGKISGDQITGLQIRGLTVEGASTTKLPDYINWKKYTDEFDKNGNPIFDSMKGGFGPTWQIAEDGTGYLGAGTMSWHDNKIILGPDTEITWASVKDGDGAVDDRIDDKLKNVKDNISSISKIMDDFNERMRDFDNQMHDLATDVGNITGEGGGGDWPTPDMGEIEETLERLEGEVTYISNNAIYSENIIGQNIVGKSIVGINLFAGVGEEDENGENPAAFGVYRDGHGFLADGAFKWYKDNTGTWRVILGEGVTIDWSKVEDSGGGSGGGSGTPGLGKFKSIVFTRVTDKDKVMGETERPTGGSWSSPIPTSGTYNWEDGIPSGEGRIFSSYRIFYSDDSQDTTNLNKWSIPKEMVDSTSLDVEYSSVLENPGNPDSNPTNWSNNADDTTIWMAVRMIDNGKNGSWEISKIKGERGENGTSIKIKGTASSKNELPNPPEDPSDSYIIGNNLWVWVPEINDWQDVGPFKGSDGKPGAAAYLHIKYATIVEFNGDEVKTVILTQPGNGESSIGAAWIGVGHTTSETNATGKDPDDESSLKTIYKWSEFLTSENVEEVVKSSLGAYHITSNHIGGKTIDNDVKTVDGSFNFVNLPAGLTYTLFEKDDYGYDTGISKSVTVGTDRDYNNNIVTKGPAWQIRNDGNGHLAQGKIYWNGSTLKIDGKSVITGIGEAIEDNEDTKNEFGNIIAEFIDADKIAVNELFTKPEDQGDSVSISENYINIKNDQTDNIVKVSSDPLSDISIDDLINTSESSINAYQSEIEFQKNNNGEYKNSNVCYFPGTSEEIKNVGYISNGGTLNVSFAIRFAKSSGGLGFVEVNNFNISEDDYNIDIDNGKNIKVELYKQNGNNWISTQNIFILKNWKNSSSAFSDDSTQATKYFKVGSCNIAIPSSGVWGIKIIISEESIQCVDETLAPIVENFSAASKIIINRNTSNITCFTEIAKDGIAITNGFNTLLLNKDGVQMACSSINNTGFYGFRVSKTGIQYCNGGDSWLTWMP